jgi:ribosomal protein L37AE/L43A
MNPAVAGLAKKMKLPIALFRIEGGYGAEPRWTDGRRKGPMKAGVVRVMEPEEYLAMSNEELVAAIADGLYVDEAVADGLYKSNKRAEYLERAVYVCPFCGLAAFESHGNEITCKACGRTVTYGEDKTLTGVGFQFPFRFVAQWYDYQEDYVNQMKVTEYTAKPLFRDVADVSEVIVYQKKVPLRKNAQIALYGDRVVLDEGQENALSIAFADADAVTVLGRNKLNIYYDKRVYQLKGGKRFNALKYVHFCYRCKNILRGEESDQFLGI